MSDQNNIFDDLIGDDKDITKIFNKMMMTLEKYPDYLIYDDEKEAAKKADKTIDDIVDLLLRYSIEKRDRLEFKEEIKIKLFNIYHKNQPIEIIRGGNRILYLNYFKRFIEEKLNNIKKISSQET
jgi:hypothetical protein